MEERNGTDAHKGLGISVHKIVQSSNKTLYIIVIVINSEAYCAFSCIITTKYIHALCVHVFPSKLNRCVFPSLPDIVVGEECKQKRYVYHCAYYGRVQRA